MSIYISNKILLDIFKSRIYNVIMDKVVKVELDSNADKAIMVRVNEQDYNKLKGLFGGQGVALARAGSLALCYLAEQLKAGQVSITKAGIIDRRG